jgi:hypothetical protein
VLKLAAARNVACVARLRQSETPKATGAAVALPVDGEVAELRARVRDWSAYSPRPQAGSESTNAHVTLYAREAFRSKKLTPTPPAAGSARLRRCCSSSRRSATTGAIGSDSSAVLSNTDCSGRPLLLCDGLCDADRLGELDGEGVPEPLCVLLGDNDVDCVGLVDAEGVALCDSVTLEVLERVCEALELPEGVRVCEPEALGLPVGDGVAVGDGDEVCDGVGVPLCVREGVRDGVGEGVAACVREGVADSL